MEVDIATLRITIITTIMFMLACLSSISLILSFFVLLTTMRFDEQHNPKDEQTRITYKMYDFIVVSAYVLSLTLVTSLVFYVLGMIG